MLLSSMQSKCTEVLFGFLCVAIFLACLLMRLTVSNILTGNATEEEIKSSFLETLEDACSSPNEVLFCEFDNYYEGLSIGIMDDEDFVNTLRNPWGI